MVAGQEELFVRSFITQFAQRRQAFSRAEFRLYARYLDRAHLRGWFEHYRAWRRDAQVNQRLRELELEMPVLALGAEGSLGTSIIEQWRRYATDVEGGVVPRSGHWLPEERPAEITRRLLAFFAEPEQRR